MRGRFGDPGGLADQVRQRRGRPGAAVPEHPRDQRARPPGRRRGSQPPAPASRAQRDGCPGPSPRQPPDRRAPGWRDAPERLRCRDSRRAALDRSDDRRWDRQCPSGCRAAARAAPGGRVAGDARHRARVCRQRCVCRGAGWHGTRRQQSPGGPVRTAQPQRGYAPGGAFRGGLDQASRIRGLPGPSTPADLSAG